VTLDACLAVDGVLSTAACGEQVAAAVTLDACLAVDGVLSTAACDSQKTDIQGQLDAKTQEADKCAADLAACNPAARRRLRRAA
jgi:hypothetical protein